MSLPEGSEKGAVGGVRMSGLGLLALGTFERVVAVEPLKDK